MAPFSDACDICHSWAQESARRRIRYPSKKQTAVGVFIEFYYHYDFNPLKGA